MPENIKAARWVREQRARCDALRCSPGYYAFAIGQAPFHIPEPIVRAPRWGTTRRPREYGH